MAERTKVEVHCEGTIGRITLDGPATRNSLWPETMAAVSAAIEALERDEAVRAILISGRGGAFSSGGDFAFLDEIVAMSAFEVKASVYANFQGAVKKLKLCPKPTVAAIDGPAVGAGCELAIAADFRVVTESACFYQSWRDLGIIPPLGGMFLLPRLIGLARAQRMILLGEKVYGKEALEIGLADQCVAEAEIEERALAIAERAAASAPLAYAAAKEGIRRGLESSLAAEWEYNLNAQALLFQSRDFETAVEAFKAGEKAVFHGR